jgi:hypothetical protein
MPGGTAATRTLTSSLEVNHLRAWLGERQAPLRTPAGIADLSMRMGQIFPFLELDGIETGAGDPEVVCDAGR